MNYKYHLTLTYMNKSHNILFQRSHVRHMRQVFSTDFESKREKKKNIKLFPPI